MADQKDPTQALVEQQQAAVAAEVEQREAAKNASVEEFYAREAQLRPTPTQQENDLAKVGQPVQEPENDGSGTQAELTRRVMVARVPGENPYETRALGQGEEQTAQPKAAPKAAAPAPAPKAQAPSPKADAPKS